MNLVKTGLKEKHGIEIEYNKDSLTDLLWQTTMALQKLYSVPTSQEIIKIEACHSAILEGAHTSISRMNDCMKNNTKPTKDDIKAINAYKALTQVYHSASLSIAGVYNIEHILNKNITTNDKNNTDANKNLHIAELLSFIGERYINNGNITAIEKAIITHFYVLHMELFKNSNQRMAVVLQNYALFNSNYREISKIAVSQIITENKTSYLKSLELCKKIMQSGICDITAFMRFMLTAISRACLSVTLGLQGKEQWAYLAIKEAGYTKLDAITAGNILHISTETARDFLNTFTRKGITLKTKLGNKNVYTFIS